MSKKKSIAKGAGAAALAVATIASGLSFGGAAASAATGGSADLPVLGTTAIVSKVNNVQFAYMSYDAAYVNPYWGYASTVAAAERSAVKFDIIPGTVDGAFQLRYVDPADRVLCLSTTRTLATYGSCGVAADDWTFKDGHLQNVGRGLVADNLLWSTAIGPRYIAKAAVGAGAPFDYLPGVITGETAALTATGAFSTTLTDRATVSGTGEPGARVELRNGTTVVASATVAADGSYSIAVPAPNKGGVLALNAVQVVNGTDDKTVAVSLDYGNAVAIATPADDASVTPGATTVSGTGTSGGRVQVSVDGGATPALTTTVGADGTWSGSVDLARGEHTLVATQLSKGNNTTTSTITVNPGQSALTPATITTDAYTPGERTTFSGTATAGATVDVLAADGTVIAGGVQVAANGSFSFQATPAAGSTTYSFRVRQTLGSDTRTDGPFTVNATVDAFAPVTVTRPATVTPGVENVFTGTATYRVLNASGTQIVPGTFTIDAQGNWTFRRAVSNGATKFDFTIEQTLNGETRVSQLFSIRANAGYTVTNATQSVRPGVVNTFTGRGPAGATYRVLNTSGTQIVPGTFTIDAQGNWTFQRAVSVGAADFKFKLDVTTADGATFTSPLFTVKAASLDPVTVSTTEVFPGRQNTFTGTGQAGATYSVLNMSDTVLDPSIQSTFRVDADGNWEFKRVVSNGAANFKFKIRQTLNGQTTTSDLFTIDAATFQAATVDNEYVNAGIWNTFTGTVTPGATVRILNTSNNVLSGVTDLQVAADGKYSFKRVVGATSSQLDFRIEQTVDGKTMIGDTVTLQARTADVTIDNTSVNPGRVNTFTGTALAGATFQVFTPGNVGDNPLASGTVAADGTFSFDRTVGTGATSYAFKIVLTKDGKQSVSAPFTIPASTR